MGRLFVFFCFWDLGILVEAHITWFYVFGKAGRDGAMNTPAPYSFVLIGLFEQSWSNLCRRFLKGR